MFASTTDVVVVLLVAASVGPGVAGATVVAPGAVADSGVEAGGVAAPLDGRYVAAPPDGRGVGPAAAVGRPGERPVTSDDVANLTVYRAGNATFEDAAAVEAAVADGRLSPADHAVVGETLVVAVESERLAARLDAGDGTPTERFLAALDGDATFRIVQTNPDTMVTRKVARVGSENATVLRASATTYVLVDTGALRFAHYDPDGPNRPETVYDDEVYAVEFGFHLGDIPPGGPYDPAGPRVDLVVSRAGFLGFEDLDRLPPARVTRSVKVNDPPAESLVVRVALESGRTVTARVDAPVAEFPDVALDLRNATPGTAYAVALVHDGRVVERLNGTVVERSATIRDARLTRVDGRSVLNATVRLSHGGSVVVLNDECEELGVDGVHTDPPGTATRVSIPLEGEVTRGILVRAHQAEYADGALYPGDGARTYVGFGGFECRPSTPVTTGTATETRTTTSSATVTAGPSPTSTGSDGTGPASGRTATGGSSTGGIPGFGTVGAVVAVGLVVVGVRRR